MLRLPSSAHAMCRGKCGGREKCRRDDTHDVVLLYAIMHPSIVWYCGGDASFDEYGICGMCCVVCVEVCVVATVVEYTKEGCTILK